MLSPGIFFTVGLMRINVCISQHWNEGRVNGMVVAGILNKKLKQLNGRWEIWVVVFS